jgi:hypothetical protein
VITVLQYVVVFCVSSWLMFCAALANECESANLSTTVAITEGAKFKGITQRCIRRMADGVRISCDSRETAVSVFCEQNGSPYGTPTSLVTSGINGTRTGICLWSGVTDGTIVVGCRAFAALKRDFSGDIYVQHMRVPDHLATEEIEQIVHRHPPQRHSCRCKSHKQAYWWD